MVSRPDFPFRGLATLPRKRGTVTVTWPLAQIAVNDEGLECDIGPTFAKVISATEGRTLDCQGNVRPGVWSCTWDQIAEVLVAGHSIIVRLKSGRGCRFAFARHTQVRRLCEEFQARAISTRRVWFTYVRAFRL